MNALGRHFLLDLKDCREDVLDDLEFIKEALSTIAQQDEEELLGQSFYHFTPQGVSGLVLSSGSHIGIHTWPEYSYAAVDIFTQGNSFDPDKATSLIIERLGCRNPSVVELKRGV